MHYLYVYFRIIIFYFILMFFSFSPTEILYISSRVLLYVSKFNFSFCVNNGLGKKVNLEKIKYEKCQPHPLTKTCPWTILPPLFLFFRAPPPSGEVIKIYSPRPSKQGGSELWEPRWKLGGKTFKSFIILVLETTLVWFKISSACHL